MAAYDAGDDHLGITTDVHMLADVVASRFVRPPLSIGLFGNWGTGKSFFMRQMRERVRELADAAARAEVLAGQHGASVSSYCLAVRQITFNAWHLVEATCGRVAGTATDQRLAELDEETARLERAVSELATGHGATAFAESRQASADYSQHLGIVSLLRRVLETFAAILDKEGDGGLERIVLYIDDLDRCPPEVVIKVLEARFVCPPWTNEASATSSQRWPDRRIQYRKVTEKRLLPCSSGLASRRIRGRGSNFRRWIRPTLLAGEPDQSGAEAVYEQWSPLVRRLSF